MEISETTGTTWNDDLCRVFRVQRPGHDAHEVAVRVSHSGTPQQERCDCKGFKFSKSRTCSHIKAVYEAGLLYANSDY